jgi:hypothetical protein
MLNLPDTVLHFTNLQCLYFQGFTKEIHLQIDRWQGYAFAHYICKI